MLGISDCRSQIWNLKFAICDPEGPVRSLTRAPLGRNRYSAPQPAPRGRFFRAQPMGLCLKPIFLLLRLRSPASPPRSSLLPKGPPCHHKRTSARRRWKSLRGRSKKVRGPAEQAESTETEQFDKPTGLLLSAREVGPRTNLPADETPEPRG